MKKDNKLHYPLSFTIAAVIWVVCMIPVPETPLDEISFIDKWTHFAMYGSLSAAIWGEYIFHHDSIAWRRLLTLGVLLPVLMGIAVELAQAYLTTYRSGDWLDAVCNSLGVLLGSVIGRIFLAIKKK